MVPRKTRKETQSTGNTKRSEKQYTRCTKKEM